ncbi:MAG TPA: nucleoside triphosphate pyrophosphohydrolase [Ignavibacteriaceae bacterium]|nr:nucleoside triphosphate pyrophosphohydrolase [Ignavibacteriaceae bacterium]
MTNKFTELVEIVKRLRKECPWDKEQTNDSIKAATVEEAYEVVEAIENKNFDELKKELGDLLLHVVFHSEIAEGDGKFTLEEVIDQLKEKLIRRHPHIFGGVVVKDADEVKRNWEQIKMTEGRTSLLEGVPENLPALHRAHRLQEKASKVGFDWEKKEDVWAKVIEEIKEMHDSEKENNFRKLEEEIGDVFFALVNYARYLNVNPESALRMTNKKFIKRFSYVEQKIIESGKTLAESSLEEMDKYWNECKRFEL